MAAEPDRPVDDKETLVVPPGEGRATAVSVGTQFSVIDLDGGQVGDLFAFNADDLCEFASASHTRPAILKLFPRAGDTIFSNLRRPMMVLEEDHSPGRHDTLYAACDPQRYVGLGATALHRSCASNLAEAMAPFGGLRVPTPQPFNVFMEVDVDLAGNMAVKPASSGPGDRLVFRALMDLVVALSSCPMDIRPISTGGISRLAIGFEGPKL